MPTYSYMTVDVFTEQRFGGNPLAVFHNADGLSDTDMQKLAAEVNYSESAFVLPPADPANTARVRIFNRVAEMPFAGHPNVGTAYVLAHLGLAKDDVLRFEEIAGLVEVTLNHDGTGKVTGATIAAPQPLSTGPELLPQAIAACVGLDAADIVITTHPPLEASVGGTFVIVEVAPDALTRATPDLARFRQLLDEWPALAGRLSMLLYALGGGRRLRARMFAPVAGNFEDPATGSANAALAALLLSRTDESLATYEVSQGVEIGRPSSLEVTAVRGPDGIRATVRGKCVPMFRGSVTL